MSVTRRTLLGALGAAGVTSICGLAGTPRGRSPDAEGITYLSCEGSPGPVRIRAAVIVGALLPQEECQIDLARGVLTRGPLPGARRRQHYHPPARGA